MRTPQPTWKKSHKCWYVKLDGKFVRLDPDEKKAQDMYFDIMSKRAKEQEEPVDLTSQNATVRQLLVAFLEWSKIHNKEKTHQFYEDYLTGPKSFAAHVPAFLRIADLKNFHVTTFMDKRFPDAKAKGSIIAAIKRPFNWAVEEGYITQNPIASYKKPRQIGRAGDDSVVISLAEYELILATVKLEEFQDYVEFLWHTGCRAQEINAMQTEWFKRKERRCVIPADLAKGAKLRRLPKPRVIRLNGRAFEIACKHALKNPDGALFRNSEGRQWTASSADNHWKNYKEKIGRKIVTTWFRHTYITDALKFGLGPMQVAKLVGHDDLQMIMRVYEHLNVDDIKPEPKWVEKMQPRFTFEQDAELDSPAPTSKTTDSSSDADGRCQGRAG